MSPKLLGLAIYKYQNYATAMASDNQPLRRNIQGDKWGDYDY